MSDKGQRERKEAERGKSMCSFMPVCPRMCAAKHTAVMNLSDGEPWRSSSKNRQQRKKGREEPVRTSLLSIF